MSGANYSKGVVAVIVVGLLLVSACASGDNSGTGEASRGGQQDDASALAQENPGPRDPSVTNLNEAEEQELREALRQQNQQAAQWTEKNGEPAPTPISLEEYLQPKASTQAMWGLDKLSSWQRSAWERIDKAWKKKDKYAIDQLWSNRLEGGLKVCAPPTGGLGTDFRTEVAISEWLVSRGIRAQVWTMDTKWGKSLVDVHNLPRWQQDEPSELLDGRYRVTNYAVMNNGVMTGTEQIITGGLYNERDWLMATWRVWVTRPCAGKMKMQGLINIEQRNWGSIREYPRVKLAEKIENTCDTTFANACGNGDWYYPSPRPGFLIS